MTVLMGEHKSAVDYGHAWDQLGENGEVLGRAPGLPQKVLDGDGCFDYWIIPSKSLTSFQFELELRYSDVCM